jgi:CubicO group peptidase (beta-lactamase class C family)
MQERLRKTRIALAAALGFFAVGCDSAAWKRFAFESFFFDPGTLENPRPIEARMAELAIPGVSIAVIYDGEIHWESAYGVKKLGTSDPVTPQTRFQAGSISKFVTAVAAFRLAEQGVIDLEADIEPLLVSWSIPSNPFTGLAPVTGRRILTHTAGFSVDGFIGYQPTQPVPTLLQVLTATPPAFNDPIVVAQLPGSGFRYSGGGFTVLQQWLIDVTGKPFPELLAEQVLSRAGMTRSGFDQPLAASLEAEAANAHVLPGLPTPYIGNVYPELAAAGLWTTASDLARLALSLQRARAGAEGEVLSPASAREMLTPAFDGTFGATGPGVFFDAASSPRWFCHSGGNVGFTADLIVSLDGKYGVAVLVNDFFAGRPFIGEIVRNVSLIYQWEGWDPDAPGC